MTLYTLTGEKAAEYHRVYAEFAAATAKASDILQANGMDSDEFREAYAAAGKLWVMLRELRGDAVKGGTV